MHIVQARAGRLLEIRIESPFDLGEFKTLQDSLRRAFSNLRGNKAVGCTDIRTASVFTQDVVEGLIQMLRGDNPLLERSGIFVATGAVFSMQAERIVRAAGNPDRRTFRDPKLGVAWLSEVLTLEERASLHRFIFFS